MVNNDKLYLDKVSRDQKLFLGVFIIVILIIMVAFDKNINGWIKLIFALLILVGNYLRSENNTIKAILSKNIQTTKKE